MKADGILVAYALDPSRTPPWARVTCASEQRAKLGTELVRRGVALEELTTLRASLEETFLALVGFEAHGGDVRDTLAVLQKELREIIGERQSRRGGFVQAIVIIAVMGVLYPASTPHFWLSAHPLAIVYFAFFPGVLAVTVAADAFAGERERKTLETLLATPLGEWAILLGKAAAAVTGRWR